jgi:hypothetical protein
MHSVIAFTVNGPVFLKGTLAVIMGIVLFIGSVYLLLAAVFGVRMGYLVLMVGLFSWMLILSMLWTFGAPGTKPNIGPRPTGDGAGAEAHWEPLGFGLSAASPRYPVVDDYPANPWAPATEENAGDVEPARVAIQEFLAEQANEEAGIEVERHIPEIAGGGPPQEFEPGKEPFLAEDFVVKDMEFASAEDGTKLVAARGYFAEGGPEVTVVAYYDQGNVPVYSWAALGLSLLGLLIHLPFLDRAEKKRKQVLTGGSAPEFRGPA